MTRLSFIVLTRLDRFDSVDQLERRLVLLRECGYEGVEFNITEPLGIGADTLERLVRKHDLAVPSFLTGEAYADGLCLCSADADVRARTVKRLIGFLDTAQQFKAVLVVGLLQGFQRDEPDPVVANRRIADALREVTDAAAKNSIDIVIEPVNHLQVGFNNSVAEVQELIANIGSPAVFPMVDTIHLNIEEQSLTEPIIACGNSLRHVHLCENNGGRFGSGHIDFSAVRLALDRIGYSRFASVKVYRQIDFDEAARTSIEFLRRAGFQQKPEIFHSKETRFMSEKQRKSVEELISTLKQQRDELKLKMHLAKAELRDEWNALDDKLAQLSREYEPTKKAASETAGEVWESLKLVGEEIKSGFNRIRKSL